MRNVIEVINRNIFHVRLLKAVLLVLLQLN